MRYRSVFARYRDDTLCAGESGSLDSIDPVEEVLVKIDRLTAQARRVVRDALRALVPACRRRVEGACAEALLMARSEIVFRSRLAGLSAPIDGVTTVFNDPKVVEADAARAIALGFGGKLLIHPHQIAPALKAFLPDQQALSWARQVLELASDGRAMQLDGAMIDRPILERARRILSLSSDNTDTGQFPAS